jgi:predicted HTH transcriptional regulator
MPYTDEKIGYQNNNASKEAASFNSKGKITIREQVLELFRERKELSAEQVSEIMNRAEISVKPRITELKNSGFIADSGKKAIGKWGTSITIWKIVKEK